MKTRRESTHLKKINSEAKNNVGPKNVYPELFLKENSMSKLEKIRAGNSGDKGSRDMYDLFGDRNLQNASGSVHSHCLKPFSSEISNLLLKYDGNPARSFKSVSEPLKINL